ncbi:MAG: helix-turn-helix domain-containing protein [Dehalococcoidales bacterium]|nr:helix-turn-helix domain-containing protein [Dehalococcoidales bacterium]
MSYERSRTIEERFQKAISLIEKEHLNAGQLAIELNVSRPTAHRIVTELKKRGYAIRSVYEEQGWCYEINNTLPKRST